MSARDAESFKLFQHRNRLLTAIREHSLRAPEEQSHSYIFQQCCDILAEAFNCNDVWAGDIDREKGNLIFFASSTASPANSLARNILKDLLTQRFGSGLSSFTTLLLLVLDDGELNQKKTSGLHCMVWPVGYQQQIYGFVAMHCREQVNLCESKNDFISHVIDDISLALFSQDTALKLKVERDFNKEIIDTIQALMVTISLCGTILSFNKRAEQVTGYKEQEILQKYWVDVMTSSSNRLEFQQIFPDTLKGGQADQQLNRFTARWEKIFIAIQDPALVVSNDNRILEANPATCAAAKKRRADVIGKKVCDILHGGHSHGTQCPLEQLIGYQKTRISETELHGLHGKYILTVSPLLEENGEINATLLVARNLTEEEVLRAEAIRVAQLAAIGELASGVAHEINDPINGIINYSQIILDDPEDPDAVDHLRNIISEGKRIAGIISNLLDFARRREKTLAPSEIRKILSNSLQLVNHLLKKDSIICSVDFTDSLPPPA